MGVEMDGVGFAFIVVKVGIGMGREMVKGRYGSWKRTCTMFERI